MLCDLGCDMGHLGSKRHRNRVACHAGVTPLVALCDGSETEPPPEPPLPPLPPLPPPSTVPPPGVAAVNVNELDLLHNLEKLSKSTSDENVKAWVAEQTQKLDNVKACVAEQTQKLEKVDANLAEQTQKLEKVDANLADLLEKLKNVEERLVFIEHCQIGLCERQKAQKINSSKMVFKESEDRFVEPPKE